MQTPAGRDRENMTGRILDYHDQQYAAEVLEDEIDAKRLRQARHAKRDNGGGALTVRDLCAEISNTDLKKVCRRLGV